MHRTVLVDLRQNPLTNNLNMLNYIDISNWHPSKVRDWLQGLSDNSKWLNSEAIIKENITGRELLLMTPKDLERLGAKKVDIQERVLEAIEVLRNYKYDMTEETLQTLILKLACQSRSLQKQLAHSSSFRSRVVSTPHKSISRTNSITLSPEFRKEISEVEEKRVSLDTLASVSKIVITVKHIVDILSCSPFSKFNDYRSMKSLLLALSIELTSTAQRDQFVELPNEIIEKSSKMLADYCDRIVQATRDPLLIQPFHLETVRIQKNPLQNDIGLVIKSRGLTQNASHIIEKIIPLSAAKKTNRLNEGDEIIQFNQCIVCWTEKNVSKLLNDATKQDDVVLMVKKRPNE